MKTAIRTLLALTPALLASAASAQNLLVNPGFEAGAGGCIPYTCANAQAGWCFDDMGFVPFGTSLPIFPRTGIQMLQFNRTACGVANLQTSDIVQIIDLTPWACHIDCGNATLDAEAWFNREDPAIVLFPSYQPASFNSNFGIYLRCGPTCVPGVGPVAGFQNLSTDSNPTTWQPVNLSGVFVPPGTRFAEIRLIAWDVDAAHANGDDPPPTEFAGHFADDASLTISVPCWCDYNGDGVCDQQDVIDLTNDIASGSSTYPCGGTCGNPDYNCDGGIDQADIDELINLVASGNCGTPC